MGRVRIAIIESPKHDWERGKYESRPWFFQVLPPERLSYEEFQKGQGKKEHNFIYYLSRQLILCFVVSSIPIYIAYKTSSKHKDIIQTVKNKIIPDETTQLIIVCFLFIYLLFTFFRNKILKNNTKYGKIGTFIFGITKKLATSFENTLRLFSGIIFILSFLWIYWEPDTVNYYGLVSILAIGFIFMSFAAYFDKFNDNNS